MGKYSSGRVARFAVLKSYKGISFGFRYPKFYTLEEVFYMKPQDGHLEIPVLDAKNNKILTNYSHLIYRVLKLYRVSIYPSSSYTHRLKMLTFLLNRKSRVEHNDN